MAPEAVSSPVRVRTVGADAPTRALIESLLTAHTGRQHLIEDADIPDASGPGIDPGEVERRTAAALRESEERLAEVLADHERLERQFYLVQKFETVGQLAGGIAHDFNNILTAIVGFGTLVSEQVRDNPAASESVAEILAAASRASSLTRQLLAFGRRQVLLPTRLNLNETVKGLTGMLRQLIGEHIDLHIVCAPDLPMIRADQSQLESALANLVINARDAMPRGGRLTIETSEVTLDASYTAAHVGVRAGRYVRMTVSDTGVGIPADVQPRIFEPFFTTKESGKGSGLGLATVYGIVKQSGGNIWVYSEPGLGATFKVYLPVDLGEGVESAPPEPVSSEWSRGTETVLLVEDAPTIRRLARDVMVQAGYVVIESGDANDALARAASHTGRIDLLVTDLVMPGPSGVDLAAQLARLRNDIRVLFISGYTDNALVRNGLLAEGVSFLQKPFAPADLLRRVRQAIDARAA